MMSKSLDDLLFLAEIAETAERYEDLVDIIKDMVSAIGVRELSAKERNLVSMAYKHATGVRRGSWRILSALDGSLDPRVSLGNVLPVSDGESTSTVETPSKNVEIVKSLKTKVEEEMRGYCEEILDLLDKPLLQNSRSEEGTVYFLKMKGDYHRYLAEITAEAHRNRVIENGHLAYRRAMEVAGNFLAPTNPVRLGLALNFSVFYYEIMQVPERACRLAKAAFDDAIAELDNLNEESYKDSSLIMQLLRDNLTLWSVEIPEDKESVPEQDYMIQ